MQTAPPVFHADGSRLDLARHGFRQIGLAIALPLVLYAFFNTPLSSLLTVAGVGLGLTALLTWGRISWGQAVAFTPEGGVHVMKRDGSTLEIAASAVQLVRVKDDCLAIVWLDDGKRRSFVIGQEGFAPATWALVRAAAQARPQPAAAS
jgi:hypothetical protein